MSKKPKQAGVQTTTQNTSQQMELPDWLTNSFKNAGLSANNQMYQMTGQGQMYEPFSGQTEAGLSQIENMARDPSQIQGFNDAFQQYQDTLGGNYLHGGAGFNAAQQAAENRIIPGVTSAFNASGRTGGIAGQSELARQIGDSFAGLYNNERQRQMGALSMAPQMQQLAFDPAARLLGVGGMREDKGYEIRNDDSNRLDRYLSQLGQIAPFYQQSSGQTQSQKPIYKSGGGLGGLLGAGLSIAGMATGNPWLGLAGKGAGLLSGSGGTMPAYGGGPGDYMGQ